MVRDAMADILTDVLRSLQLKGTVYFQADFRAPWGMDIPAGRVANFHVVVAGGCYVRGSRDRLERLEQGDIALLPRGDAHALSHGADAPLEPARDILTALQTSDSYGGSGQPTRLICGHFQRGNDLPHPLFESLPEMVVVRAADVEHAAWISPAIQLASMESGSGHPGSAAVVDRLADVLLIQVLQAFARTQSGNEGFLAAISDAAIARSLALIHSRPAERWTVESLSRAAGMSRSAFAARFKQTVGESPLQYLTLWRMQRAHELLASSQLSLAEIGERVGYESEWSFAKAFKRAFGVAPGSARRAAR